MARIAAIEELAPLVVHDLGKADNDLLQLYLDGAEAFAERWTGRTFSPLPVFDPETGLDSGAPVTKRFSARNKRTIRVPDLREATSVTLDGSVLTRDSTYWYDSYVNPAQHLELVSLHHPSVGQRGELAVTGRWGFHPSPPEVKVAILQLAARGWSRRDARWSDTMQTSEGAAFFYSRNMPDEVASIFKMYRLPNLAVV